MFNKQEEKKEKQSNGIIGKLKKSDITPIEIAILVIVLMIVGIWMLKHLLLVIFLGILAFVGLKIYKKKKGNNKPPKINEKDHLFTNSTENTNEDIELF